jgi:hypothetical protein
MHRHVFSGKYSYSPLPEGGYQPMSIGEKIWKGEEKKEENLKWKGEKSENKEIFKLKWYNKYKSWKIKPKRSVWSKFWHVTRGWEKCHFWGRGGGFGPMLTRT